MASGGSGGTDGRGGAWPTSLGTPDTDELIRLGLMVLPGCRLPHIFHITADGYPTRGPGATPEELRGHEGGRWNIAGRTRFWTGKDFWKVVAQARRDSETGGPSSAPRRPHRHPPAAMPSPSSSGRPVPTLAGPAAPPAVEIPPEQFALREDGDPNDCPGYLIALWASQTEAAAAAEAREAAELQAALDAAAAMAAAAEAAELQAALDMAAATGAVQAPAQAAPVEDDAVDWDDAGKSSNDDDGDGGAGEIVDLAASDDDE
ncbi:hypothetical protein CFC21_049915 [Triticum aestivum]|uniref:NAC domain-containing protein n=2 Tax=Triticum aestivum TaxID=4565 RepID=A0A9R1G304_WHEAT|nr:uncharacterized protein LOC123080584 [Triticum aestivum]KAF7039978.1 hypothetical protein CFC21_049915 [Triticum aestivum]